MLIYSGNIDAVVPLPYTRYCITDLATNPVYGITTNLSLT